MGDLLRPAWRTRPIAPHTSSILTVPPPPFPIQLLPPELLLQIGSNLDTPTLCCLSRATRRLHSCIQTIIYQRALSTSRPNSPTPFQWCPTPGRTTLHFLAAHAHLPGLDGLLARIGSRRNILDTRDAYGHTALISAVLLGHEDVAMALLKAGADPDVPTRRYGWTAMHCAAVTGHPRLLQILIRAGADREARDTLAGFTPLHLAVLSSEYRDCMGRCLVKLGCRWDARDVHGVNVGETARLLASRETGFSKRRPSEVSQARQQEGMRVRFKWMVVSRRSQMLRYEMDRCRWCVRRRPWASREGSSHGWHHDGSLQSWEWDRRKTWFSGSRCEEKMNLVDIAAELSNHQGRM